jgi:hypothetical protein
MLLLWVLVLVPGCCLLPLSGGRTGADDEAGVVWLVLFRGEGDHILPEFQPLYCIYILLYIFLKTFLLYCTNI